MKVKQIVFFALIIFNPGFVYADSLDCYLPSMKDGEVLEKMSISRKDESISVYHVLSEQTYRKASSNERFVLYHHYSVPVEEFPNGKMIQIESAYSLVLMRSNFENTEYSPDILIIDWDAGKIKTGSPYSDKFTTRWKCIEP